MNAVCTALLLVLATLAPPAWSAVGDELGCISGDCQNGVGTLVEETPEGLRRYRGDFINGKFHGFGKLELIEKKIVYKGNFRNGEKSGRGTEWDRDNNVYIGQWSRNRRNGAGLQAFRVEEWREDKFTENWLARNTENFQGTFRNDNFDGEGTYRWPDGVTYTGGWAANKKHGRGYFLYPTGLRSDRIFEFDERVYDEPLPR
ncbi:MAG: hypothetical protein ACO3PV_03915 [Pseudohongiellaceae bacterium]|jgi:hypothetical protein